MPTSIYLEMGQEYYEEHFVNGRSWKDIASEYAATLDAVKSCAQAYKRSLVGEHAAPQFTDATPVQETERVIEADPRRAAFERFLGSIAATPDESTSPIEIRKVMVIADLHGSPSEVVLKSIVDEQPDLLVIAGDLLDSRESSPHFDESSPTQTIREEIQSVRAYIEVILLNTCCKILIMKGNHDAWPARRANEALAAYPDVLAFWKDPLDLLIEQLPSSRVEMCSTEWAYHYPDRSRAELGESKYMAVIGDAFISHANFTGSSAGDAVRKLSLWLNKWKGTLGLPELTLLVQAHVHNVCFIESDGGHQIWVEPGAALEPRVEGYKVSYQPKWRPASVGALVFEQKSVDGVWKTSRSSVRLVRPRRD